MTTLVIRAPAHRTAEFAWVCDVVFTRWLGLVHRIEPHALAQVEIHADSGCVLWADEFFAQADARWLAAGSLPPLPTLWPLPDAALRDRIGQPNAVQCFGDGRFELQASTVRLPVDITGCIFFMLSRYEEAVPAAPVDQHGRFPGSASLVQRAGLALRPLVDEWVELLWWALQRIAPGLQRKPRRASTWVSCDVDAPYSPAARSNALAVRQAASHLVNDRSPARAAAALMTRAASGLGLARKDPFDCFDWMMEVNEAAGHRMSFFFIAARQPQRIDGCYELAEPRIAALMRRIVGRGHEIGLHGSYRSVDEPARLAAELADLQTAAAAAGSTQAAFGGRQHYLRWRAASSARRLGECGLAYDSTLGFPDIAGLRCGTSHAYPLFDLLQRRALDLIERPLVLMDVTVTSHTYMGLGDGDAAWRVMSGLRDACHRFGGEFALLWHNSNLGDAPLRERYRALLQPAA